MGTITDKHVMAICKPGQMEKTCRYLLIGMEGWECGKMNPQIKKMLDERVTKMSAQGDNCDGWLMG
jgi:hypothetical protein